MSSNDIAGMVCVVAVVLALLLGISYDTYKEEQCKMEAFKAGVVSSEIEKICR